MFNKDQGDGQKKLMEPDYVKKARSAHKVEFEEGLIQHSLKRVKKKMNDYILSHYERMFFKKQSAADSGKPTPAGKDVEMTDQTISLDDIM